MIQEFYINTGATLPVLRMELINDGRYDFNKFYDAIQGAKITFSMKDAENGILKISKAPTRLLLAETGGCEEKWVIEYDWNERDTKKSGIYKGWFDITFNEISEPSTEYEDKDGNIVSRFPIGKLVVPIQEDLLIYVK